MQSRYENRYRKNESDHELVPPIPAGYFIESPIRPCPKPERSASTYG